MVDTGCPEGRYLLETVGVSRRFRVYPRAARFTTRLALARLLWLSFRLVIPFALSFPKGICVCLRSSSLTHTRPRRQGRGNVNAYHSTGEKCGLNLPFDGRFFLFSHSLRLADLAHAPPFPFPSQGMVQLHFNAAFTRKSPFTSCYYRTRSCSCFVPCSGCSAPCFVASNFSPCHGSVRCFCCSLAGDFPSPLVHRLPAPQAGGDHCLPVSQWT